jgi:hypothetical protein
MRKTRLKTRNDTRRVRPARAILVVAASAVALLAAVPVASAAPAAATTPTNNCWKDVVNDWLAHQPNVTGLYPIPCYTQAIQHLNAYSDVQAYSNAMDDIHRALLIAIHEERGGPGDGGSSSGGSSGGTSGGSSGGSSSGGSSSGSSGSSSSSSSQSSGPIIRLFNDLGPGNAQSVPLPLLVLGGLAVLLLFAALATWITRRLQARRLTPATAPATAPGQAPPKPC